MSAQQTPGNHISAEDTLEPISADIHGLLDAAQGRAMSLAEIEAHLKGRGYALLVLFLAAPFPIPNVPGLSTPFGLAIGLIGVAFMLRRRPRLPAFILRKQVSFATLQKVVPFVARIMRWLERRMRERLECLVAGPVMTSLFGLGIISGGFFLALPLPIPLTNTMPALSIILLVTGTLCRDGLAVLVGYVLGVLSWIYLGAWVWFGAYLMPKFQALWHGLWGKVHGWF